METTIQGGFRTPSYNVTRQGSRITIQQPDNGMRCMGEHYTVDFGSDTVSLRSREKNYDISLHSPNELWVQTPANGCRGGGDGYSIKFDQPVQNFQRTALTVASSLCGVPIVFADGGTGA